MFKYITRYIFNFELFYVNIIIQIENNIDIFLNIKYRNF